MPVIVGKDEKAVKRITCKNCASINEYTQSEVRSISRGRDYGGGEDLAPVKSIRAALEAAKVAQEPVQLVPDNCTGAAYVMEFGTLHINKDGTGHFVFDEDKPEHGDDRCVRLSADDLNEFRHLFTTGRFTSPPVKPDAVAQEPVAWQVVQTLSDGSLRTEIYTDQKYAVYKAETAMGVAIVKPLHTSPPVKPDAVPPPYPVQINCPKCDVLHIDEGEWATRPHKTRQCQGCGHEWRPFEYPTVGVKPDADLTQWVEDKIAAIEHHPLMKGKKEPEHKGMTYDRDAHAFGCLSAYKIVLAELQKGAIKPDAVSVPEIAPLDFAKARFPDLFSDNHMTAHRAASPFSVNESRKDAIRDCENILVCLRAMIAAGKVE